MTEKYDDDFDYEGDGYYYDNEEEGAVPMCVQLLNLSKIHLPPQTADIVNQHQRYNWQLSLRVYGTCALLIAKLNELTVKSIDSYEDCQFVLNGLEQMVQAYSYVQANSARAFEPVRQTIREFIEVSNEESTASEHVMTQFYNTVAALHIYYKRARILARFLTIPACCEYDDQLRQRSQELVEELRTSERPSAPQTPMIGTVEPLKEFHCAHHLGRSLDHFAEQFSLWTSAEMLGRVNHPDLWPIYVQAIRGLFCEFELFKVRARDTWPTREFDGKVRVQSQPSRVSITTEAEGYGGTHATTVSLDHLPA